MLKPPQGDHDPFSGAWAQTAAQEAADAAFDARVEDVIKQAKLLLAFLLTLETVVDRKEAITLACAVWRA